MFYDFCFSISEKPIFICLGTHITETTWDILMIFLKPFRPLHKPASDKKILCLIHNTFGKKIKFLKNV